MRRASKAGYLVAGIVGVLLYNLVILVVSTLTGGHVLYRSNQPAEVHYESLEPYEIRAVEGAIEWNTLGWPRLTEIWVTKKGNPDYGHEVTTSLKEIDRVTWRIDGVEVFFSRGQRLFIPKNLFLGGR